MTLTKAHGPLSGHPPETVNYRLEGPAHRLLLGPFPRRVRARVEGETVLDSDRGMLLHETGLLPVLYVPAEDVRTDVLEPSGHTTHCRFKGDATYHTLRVGDRVVENAVWRYEEPLAEAAWLRGLASMTWSAADAWLDEDEPVQGHLRDPYHRVDVRASSRRLRVVVDGDPVADTRRPMLLSETGLPNRWYVPPDDVRADVLRPTDTTTHCPYKGTATYRTVQIGGRAIEDAAFVYEDPFEDALKVRGHLSFAGEGVRVEVDGEEAA